MTLNKGEQLNLRDSERTELARERALKRERERVLGRGEGGVKRKRGH